MGRFVSMREYVLILCHYADQILVVVKDKPDWMAGRVNLIGGKIEPNETATDAVIRECMEEVGYEPKHVQIVGEVKDDDYIIYCGVIEEKYFVPKPRPEETEQFFWVRLEDLVHYNIMPNLKVIVPLMLKNLSYFSIYDVDKSLGGNQQHTVRITV